MSIPQNRDHNNATSLQAGVAGSTDASSRHEVTPCRSGPIAPAGRVGLAQRFRRGGDCPVCHGGETLKKGRGERCAGYVSADGRYAFCTREEYAGTLPLRSTTTPPSYMHRLDAPCRCGETHSGGDGAAPDVVSLAPERTHQRRRPTAIYAYANELRKLRYEQGGRKWFVWQHADGAGDWIDGRDGRDPGAYLADTLTPATIFTPVFLPEGEKCANSIIAAGGVAISPPDGVGSWRSRYSEALRGRQVIVLVDADEPGRGHALAVAQDVATVAQVRMIELDGAHDVADWLAAGHTLDELLTIAAATACMPYMPQTRNPSPAPQDENTPCANCARLQQTLDDLYRERRRENQWLAIPNEKVSAPAKIAAIAVGRELRDGKHLEHDRAGRPRIYRAAIADRTGTKENAVSSQLKKVAATGLLVRNDVKTFDDSATYWDFGPNSLAVDKVPTPQRVTQWGGYRHRACPNCGSLNLETVITCRDCSAVIETGDTNPPVYAQSLAEIDASDAQTRNPSPAPQDENTEEPPKNIPPGIPVNGLAPAPQDDTQDEASGLVCPLCGGHETDGIAHKSGAQHCQACDYPMVVIQKAS